MVVVRLGCLLKNVKKRSQETYPEVDSEDPEMNGMQRVGIGQSPGRTKAPLPVANLHG